MTDPKNKHTLDSFVEDLDDLEKSLQNVVDSAEDDATLNRLLVEDLDSDSVVADVDDIDFSVNEDNLVHHIDEVSTPELDALSQIGHVDDFKESSPKTNPAEPFSAPQQAEALAPETVEPAQSVVQIDPAVLEDQYQQLLDVIEQIREHQQLFGRELRHKAEKENLLECLESLEKLRTDFDKQQRSQRAEATDSPVQLYVVGGLAGAALLLALVFGWQTIGTQADLSLLQQKLEQHEQKLGQLPASDAANQNLRAQVDTLNQSSQLLSEQVSELAKSQTSATRVNDEQGKQLNKLASQHKQVDDSLEALQTRLASLEKSKPVAVLPAKTDKAIDTKKTDKFETVAQNWTVTLAGSKHDWYAARKAEEYGAKGFAVKISRTTQKGEPWFRLFADGFKNQQEAEAFAARARKVLNLDSVSIGHN